MRTVYEFSKTVLDSVGQKMFGMEEVTRLCLVALYTGGHVLLEGNPGFGKTELIKTLGNVLKLPFGRIQFTPDLMPADITGTYMPDFNDSDSRKLVFQKGPIFTSLLLADEINRATPKTQSAMLEAMAEQQVTVLGEKKILESPFIVLATQNPIDHEGTYDLPEAQADRFMFKVRMPVPNAGILQRILMKHTGESSSKTDNINTNAVDLPTKGSPPPRNQEDSTKIYHELRSAVENVVPVLSLETHIVNMFLAANQRYDELKDLDSRQIERTKILVENHMIYGLGPRAVIAVMLGAKAFAKMFQPKAEVADAQALDKIVLPALRHRIKLDIDWEHSYLKHIQRTSTNETWLQDKLLADFCIATAPKHRGYQAKIKGDPYMEEYVRGEDW